MSDSSTVVEVVMMQLSEDAKVVIDIANLEEEDGVAEDAREDHPGARQVRGGPCMYRAEEDNIAEHQDHASESGCCVVTPLGRLARPISASLAVGLCRRALCGVKSWCGLSAKVITCGGGICT